MNAAFRRRFPHRVVKSSAGSGKTQELTNRSIALLDAGVPPERILAATFTRKAAGEILDRVLFRLADATRSDEQRQRLAASIDRPDLSRERCLELLETAIRRLNRLQVGTLDRFFGQVARSFSLELGLPAQWTICEELEDQWLRDEAVDAVLREDQTRDLLNLVHLLTKGHAQRSVSGLVRETVSGVYDIFQETDEAAWNELNPQAPLSETELARARDALLHAPLPEDRRCAAARQTDYENALAGDWDAFISKGLAGKVLQGETTYHRRPIPPETISVYQRLLDHARAELVGRMVWQARGAYQLLAKFDAHYRRLKQERGALRFDDVTRALVALFASGDAEQLALRLDARIDHLLLDEFQDTSLAQWQVLRPLAEQATRDGETSFFCVGDVKQAIYGWRGGVAEIFEAVTAQLPGIQTDQRNTSYRSAPPVIETVNRIFSGLAQHGNLAGYEETVRTWAARFQPHTAHFDQLCGYVTLETAPAADEQEKADHVTIEFAARRVADLAARAPGASIGVLVRKNDKVARMIYHLRTLGVHASEEGGMPLTDSAAVRIVLSLLRLADHPADTISRAHLANSPLGEALELTDAAEDAAAGRLSYRVRRQLLDAGYGPTLDEWARRLAPSCNRRELDRLLQLVELAYDWQPQATLRADDFVALVESRRVPDPAAANVRVMTVHQAKGLQFDLVVLPELDFPLVGQRDQYVVGRPSPTEPINCVIRYANETLRRLLPERFRRLHEEHIARDLGETLCVLYVALTRAKHALHMIVAPASGKKGELPKTAAGLLRAALTDGAPLPPETLCFEAGDRRWHERSGLATGGPAAAGPPAEPLVVRLAPPAGRRSRGLARVAPSSLEGGTRRQLRDALAALERRDALRLGTIIHRWFEQIEWLDDGPPPEQTLRQIAMAELGAAADEIEAALAEFREMLAPEPIARLLWRDAYRAAAAAADEAPWNPAVTAELAAGPLELAAHCERPFAVREKDAILSGSIDRLVLLRREGRLLAAEVIDFKTDQLPPGDDAAFDARVEHYRPQVEAYRRAASRMLHLPEERIAVRLAFLRRGVCRAIA